MAQPRTSTWESSKVARSVPSRISVHGETLYEEAKLDRKTIELIPLALLAGRRCETGVKVHTATALRHGATPEEIRGALLMSIAVFGNSSAFSGLHWGEPILEAAGVPTMPEDA